MKRCRCRRNTLALADERCRCRPDGRAARNPRSSDQVFKNIQVLKGIPVDDFLDTMGIMSAALGFDCVECHVDAGTDDRELGVRHRQEAHGPADDADGGGDQPNQLPRPAGRHLLDVSSRPRHSSQHAADRYRLRRAGGRARSRSSLSRSPGSRLPTRFSTNICKRSAALERLANVTSFIATGTSEGFRGFGGGGQVQIFAKAPDQRATIIKFAENIGRQDAIRVFDGRKRMGVGAAVCRSGICPGWERTRWGPPRRAVVVSGSDKEGAHPAARGSTR